MTTDTGDATHRTEKDEPESERLAFLLWHAMYREGGGGSPDRVLERLADMVERRDELGLTEPEQLSAAVLAHRSQYGIHQDDLGMMLRMRHHHERAGHADVLERMEAMRMAIRRDVLDVPLRDQGRPEKDEQTLDSKVYGEGESYLRRRLRRDRPDLYERVASGELSAHAAAVEAGISKQRRSVPIKNPHAAIAALMRVFTAGELRRALDDLDPED